jgi:hypothetical protein
LRKYLKVLEPMMNRDELKLNAEKYGHQKRPILKSISAHCLDCCIERANEVRLCEAYTCNLWLYKTGKNPFSGAVDNLSTLKNIVE